MKWIYKTHLSYTKQNLDQINESDIVGFKGIKTVRQNGGQYIPTECCAVVFADSTEAEFFTDKAIKDISIKQNPR